MRRPTLMTVETGDLVGRHGQGGLELAQSSGGEFGDHGGEGLVAAAGELGGASVDGGWQVDRGAHACIIVASVTMRGCAATFRPRMCDCLLRMPAIGLRADDDARADTVVGLHGEG